MIPELIVVIRLNDYSESVFHGSELGEERIHNSKFELNL